jgi:hypothetical protein
MARHDDAPSPVRELAAEISSRLEVAQLEQRSEELKSLAELTGWTPAELQRPISMEGYWLLITNTMGHRETEILFGVSEVLYQVRTEGSKWLAALQESDVRVKLSDDMPWMAASARPAFARRTARHAHFGNQAPTPARRAAAGGAHGHPAPLASTPARRASRHASLGRQQRRRRHQGQAAALCRPSGHFGNPHCALV